MRRLFLGRNDSRSEAVSVNGGPSRRLLNQANCCDCVKHFPAGGSKAGVTGPIRDITRPIPSDLHITEEARRSVLDSVVIQESILRAHSSKIEESLFAGLYALLVATQRGIHYKTETLL